MLGFDDERKHLYGYACFRAIIAAISQDYKEHELETYMSNPVKNSFS